MISCPIYDKNGVVKNAVIDTLELHDEWMAECYVTASVKSPVPIDFEVGDYILYRGEQYTIQYSPNLLKKATSGSYQEGFVYDNIKFVGSQDDVVRCDFNDIVLNDNEMHYTALSTFPFYCESVDDLLDRIQANLEDLYPGQWIIIGLNTVRNYQRGTAVGRASAFDEAYRTYIDPAGTAKTDPYGKQGVAESVDNITCWDAMKKVHDDFDLNFIVRGRVIVVGTAGVYTPNTFRYGRGNGLYEIERVGESDQQIITRLRAYGSSANLPQHYYATLNKQVYATITTIKNKFSTTGADFLLDLDFDKKYFTYRSESYPGTTEAPNYIIEMMANDVTVRGYVTKDAETGKCYVYCEYTGGDDDRDEPDSTKMAAFVQALTANDRLYFADYVNKDSFGDGHYDYAANHLPDNMAVSRLMLPGFPTMSLNAWVQAHKNDPDKTWLAQAIADGFTFSTELYRPYIDSPNKNQFGVRPGSIYFDGSDETDDIHPTIEGMSYNNAPIDEVYAADQVEDNGVYPAGDEVKNINITLPDLGFDLDKYYEEGASIDMKNGMCGARSFKIANKPTKDVNNRWVCNVERVHDESLDLWFPYCDFQIHGSSEVGHNHGDKYVLTGIEMPDAYIASASIKLLQASIEALKKNHAPRFTFQPRIDEIWMQRQHDTATLSQGVVSLHDTLKAGDIFSFADTDLNIDENVIIDVLTIRENGNNGIPTYDITLRDEKEVSPIQKITNKVESIISGSTNINGVTGGLTVQQIRSIINNFGGAQFLSKLNDDTAQGFITMLKGLQVGNQFVSGLLGEGGVFRRDADGKVYIEADKLYVRMKAYFDNVEIKDYEHTSGNRIASKAGLKCVKVEAYNADDELIEENPQTEPTGTVYYRLYFRAKDGDDTIDNNFVVGDQAFCDKTTFDNNVLAHHRYWRLVVGKNSTLQDDEEFGYIDLSASDKESGSAIPLAGDDVSQLGNRTDVERQGAIIEFVGGENAPAYQIYQGINTYSLSGKCMIDIGFDSQTGLARMNVAGNFRFGSPDNTGSYIKYDSQANQGQGQLDIKAHVEFTNSDQELDNFVQSHQRDDSYDDTEVRGLIDGLQDQIDGQIESWFYNYAPVAVDSQGAPTSNVPSNVEPYKSWNDADVAAGNDAQKIAHLGDTFTNNKTGYCWRFTRNSSTNAFEWTIIQDSAVITALQNAAKAQDTADHKRRVFLTQPVPPYDAGDMWVNAVYPANYTGVTDEVNHNYNNDILKCVTAKASDGSFSINDWALASKYTDDSKFNGYISALLNNTGLSGDSAAAAVQNAILGALGVGTVVAGGLLLTSLIGMRQYNGSGDKSDVSNYTTWAGISGQYNANVLGGGMAAWYGGGMLDKETLTNQQIAQGWNTLRWAKGVDRFDGSGYRADGNISWNANGALTIKNITTLSDSNNNNILNELATFNSAFTFGTSGQGSTTALYITPQVPFKELYIGTSNADKQEVATKNWVNQNFVTTTFFDNLFRLYNGYGNSATQINVNGTLPTDKTNLNIEAMFGFWTKKYISALGQGDDGTTSYTTLAQLNDVTLTNPTANQILVYDGTHWRNQNQQSVYELPVATTTTLGGIKVGTTLAISSGVLNLPTTGVTAGTYKRVTVDAYGRVTSGDNTDTDTNTWRNIYVGGTSKVGTGIDTKAINFKAGSNVSVSFVAAGTGSGQSGNANYFDVVISATDTTYSAATQSAAGLMSAADKKKLDGIAANANNYSLPLAASGTRGGVQIGYTTDAANRNYAVQLSSEKMYVNVPWENTWRGIQNNLTSQSTTDSLSAYQGYLLANGSARDNSKLPLTGGTLTGTLTARDVVVQSAYTLKIGDAILKWDSANNALKLYKLSGSSEVAVNFYATGGVSALGMSEDGTAGAGDVTWALLASSSDTRQIALSHLTTALGSYATQSWVDGHFGYTTSGKNYAVKLDTNGNAYVNVPWEAGTYSLPLAANGTRGGIQLGYTQSGKNYPIQLSGEKAYVNVPWTDTTYTAGTGISLSGTTFSNSGVRAVSISGNSLRVNTNGTNADLTIPYASAAYQLYNVANVDGGNTHTYLWRRIAFSGERTTNWVDCDALILIKHNYNGGNFGLLKISFRTDEITAGANAGASATWLARSGFASDSVKVALYKVKNKAYADIYLSVGLYPRCTVHALKTGGWTFYDSRESDGSANPVNAYTSIESAATAIHGVAYTSITNSGDGATVHYANSAGKATNDSDGNAINTTYLKKSGGTMTNTNVVTNLNADLLDGLHSTDFSYAHQSDFAFNAAHHSNYVTFDKNNPAGAPAQAWYNGFVSTHNSYLSSYIINKHRTHEWYVGYFDSNADTNPSWVSLVHSGNIGSQSVAYATSAGSATQLTTARTLWGQSFNGTANVSGDMTSVGSITFAALTGTNARNILYQQMADNDYFRIRCGGTASNGGWVEIATADDGNEPIYVRQYTGVFSNVTRTLTLLDGSGNTSVPNTLSVGGALNVTGATTLTGLLTANGGIAVPSSKTLKIGDAYLSYDSTNNAIRVSKNADGTGAANFYAIGGVSALGQSADGSAGTGDVTWALLASNSDTRQIALSHLTTALGTLTSYTTSGKNYAVQKDSSNHLFVNVPWDNTNTTYSAGAGISLSGTTFSNSGVRATTINGNYLRVNTNGTNADLTIPYATSAGNADTLDGYHAIDTSKAWYTLCNSTYQAGDNVGIVWKKIASIVTTANDNIENDFMIEIWCYADQNYASHRHGFFRCTSYGKTSTSIVLSTDAGLEQGAGANLYATIDSNRNIWIGIKAYYTCKTCFRVIQEGTVNTIIKSNWEITRTAPNTTYITNNGALKNYNGTVQKLALPNVNVDYATTSGTCTGNASTATKATQDSDGNAINTTYLKKSGGAMSNTHLVTNLNADYLDGYHESSFLRYRAATGVNGEATLWSQLGLKQYSGALPDSLSGAYTYGQVVSFATQDARFEIYASHQSSNPSNGTNGLYYRTGWDSDKRQWTRFLDSNNSSVSKSGETLTVKINGTSQSLTNTTYSAGKGLRLSGTQFISDAPRVAKDSKAFGGAYTWIMEEYTAGANYNLPSNAWYHIMSTQGADTTYGTQLALGMTTAAAYYRVYNGGSWGNWQSIINTWRGIQNNLTSQSTTDSLSAYQGYLLANGSARDNTKLPLAGGTMTGKLQVNAPIVGYNYSQQYGTAAAFIFDKSGSNWTGIGANGESDTIYFSACGSEGAWVHDYKQIWKFNGNIKADKVQIGSIELQYDSTNNAIKVIKSDGSNANLYATGGISALGAGQESGGGGNYLPLAGGVMSGSVKMTSATGVFGGLCKHSDISPTGDPSTLWLYNAKELSIYGAGINIENGINCTSPDITFDSSNIRWLHSLGTHKLMLSYYDSSNNMLFGSAFYVSNSGATYWQSGRFDGESTSGYPLILNVAGGGVCVHTTGSNTYALEVGGSVGANSYNNRSDIRTKNVIKDVDLRLDQIAKAPAFEYYWRDTSIDHDLHVGSSAQYWQSVLPQVVTTAKDKMGTLSMQYGVAALISAITVARKVMTHEEKIALLETRVSALEKENGEQEMLINSLQEELAKFKAA